MASKSERVLTFAVALWVAAFVVSSAWSILRPVIPFLIVVIGIVGFAKWHRR